MFELIVIGEPKGKGRPRFTKKGFAFTPKDTVFYENLVKSEFQAKYPFWKPTNSNLEVKIIGYFKAPKSFPKKKTVLVDGENLRYNKKIDADNLAKIILDSLNGIAYLDDKQVTDLTVLKRYSTKPRTEIYIRLVDEIDNSMDDQPLERQIRMFKSVYSLISNVDD